MKFTNINQYIEDLKTRYHMSEEDSRILRNELIAMTKELESERKLSETLLKVINKYIPFWKRKKIAALIRSNMTASIISDSKITFHKFNVKELENPLVFAGVMRNILGKDPDYAAWEYLRVCMKEIVRGGVNYMAMNELITMLDGLYQTARHDCITGNDPEFSSALLEIVPKEDEKPVILSKSTDEIRRICLTVLNMVKDYNNSWDYDAQFTVMVTAPKMGE